MGGKKHYRPGGNLGEKRAKLAPTVTPEMQEKLNIQTFIKEIELCLNSKEDNDAFRAAFRTYKVSPQPLIDEFVHSLFGVFLGDREHAVCSLEVPNYQRKRVILVKLSEQVESRHRDRYNDLVSCHL